MNDFATAVSAEYRVKTQSANCNISPEEKLRTVRGTSLLHRRGVASATPIERLSERVNIFLNTKRMHIPWGPMCVSYPDTSAHVRIHHTPRVHACASAHARGPNVGPPPPPYTKNELPEVFFSSVHRETTRRRRDPVNHPPLSPRNSHFDNYCLS